MFSTPTCDSKTACFLISFPALEQIFSGRRSARAFTSRPADGVFLFRRRAILLTISVCKYSFDEDLRNVMPWARSHWSHTDLQRLKKGRVSAQVSYE